MVDFKVEPIEIKLRSVKLNGTFFRYFGSKKLVIFAHGSGSSRLSPRNIAVANYLLTRKISSFLFDLLTEEEDKFYKNRFEIGLISNRLIEVTRWLKTQKNIRKLELGYFGSSTGAAAALKAAVKLPKEIKAIVSRGGRPDLVMVDLRKVTVPTLLVVGELDDEVVKLNQKAYDALGGIKKIEIISGATHLFEEPGKIEKVSKLAADWFDRY
ncbi:MAG: alpha/beta hydrolase [Candidatus Shapirobacteria bacterium]|nr:alpha/beta hydrolase [Candidatus Shapirobacteria bacterium]MDD3002752.1 alpha/beta hydrolase [Candidatus Shapirobacteria bacterium]MDD4383478.1 alpha/beta hydrolase [Candidatus Shapirobacteria bacterium]